MYTICKEFLTNICLEKIIFITVNTGPVKPEFYVKILSRANQHLSHKVELML